MTPIVDITGQRYGRWTVIALHPERSRWREAMWLCRCDCGAEAIVRGGSLREGGTTNCGCARRETKHGLIHSRDRHVKGT
jgi:hypothetical protein